MVPQVTDPRSTADGAHRTAVAPSSDALCSDAATSDAATSDAPAARSLAGSARGLVVSAVITGCLSLALLLGLPERQEAFLPGFALPWWVLALCFVASESFVLHLQVRRQAQSISLGEMPLVLGLFFAAPAALLVGRIVAAVVLATVVRRAPLLKSVFNLALTLAETALALALFSALAGAADGPVPQTWLAAYVAALTADIFTVLAVSCVVAVYDGGLQWNDALRRAGHQYVPVLAVTIALVAVTGVWAAPVTAWLFGGFAVLVVLAFRAYASLAEQHLNLERLYRFSQAVSSAPEIDEVMINVLGEAKDLLRSERASVALVAPDGGLLARMRLGSGSGLTRSEEPPTAEDTWVLQRVVEGGSPLLMTRGTRVPEERRWLDSYGMRDAVAVPLSGGAGIVGVLVVSDRLGDYRSFGQDDVLLLETVANHASVALRNGELIGQLRHEALHDGLTGLPNRTFLHRRIAAALEEVAAGRAPGAAVMILDLDGFKDVNDTLGHQQGDALLVQVAARLTAAVGPAGTVARLGADEFAVLVHGTADEDAVLHIGRRVLRVLEQPIPLDGLELEVGASVGVALAPVHAHDASALLKRADLAMHDAKASTRSLRLYEPELDTDGPRRLTLVSELRAALQNGGLQVHVQPQARAADGTVVRVEALVRWQHPDLASSLRTSSSRSPSAPA